MYNVDDIRSCIQEWFAEAIDVVDVAKTYNEIRLEAEEQMKYMFMELVGKPKN